jgi:hypothetical protein
MASGSAAAADATIPYEFTDFTYRIDTKDYSSNKPKNFGPGDVREIGVKLIPKGTLLFHHYLQKDYPADYSQEDRNYANYATFLQRYAIQDCKYIKSENEFELCFSTTNSKSKFFYPVPAAGFGLAYLGEKYNSCITFVTTRDMHVAMLKSGTRIRDDLAIHRKIPMSFPGKENYDVDRVRICNKIGGIENPTCEDGNDYDPCLTESYRKEKKIDGYTAIGIPDSILQFMTEGFRPRLNKLRDYLREFLNSIDRERDPYKKDLLYRLYNTIMLLLETDVKNNSIAVGFAEYALEPFGHEAIFPEMNGDEGDDIFRIIEDKRNASGSPVFRKVRVPVKSIGEFVKRFLDPHNVVKPILVSTTKGSYSANLANFGNYPAVTSESRKDINYSIAHFLFEKMGGMLYEPRSNLLLLARECESIRQQPTKTQFICDKTSGLFPPNQNTIGPIIIGHHDQSLLTNQDIDMVSLYKILQMTISNTKKSFDDKVHMYDFVDTRGFQFAIPAGPIFQPFDPSLSSQHVLETYWDILQTIESGMNVHSWQHIHLQNQFDHIKGWFTFPFSERNNPRYHAGYFTPLQIGGKRLNILGTRRNLGKKLKIKTKRNYTTKNRNNRKNIMYTDSDGFCEETGGHSSMNIVPHTEATLSDFKEFVEGIGKDLFMKISGPSVRVVRKNLYDNPTYVLVEDTKEIKNKKSK